jgi:hypothetical protein
MNQRKMNLTELVEPKHKKSKRMKVILTEDQMKKIIETIKKEKSIKKDAEESKTSKR